MSNFQLELPFRLPPAPEARERHILLGRRIVAYQLTRSSRRTLGLTIDQRGLRVGAPRHAAIAEIEGFIAKNAAWVLKKLDEWQSAAQPAQLVVRDGAWLPVLGEEHQVRVVPGANRSRWEERRLVLEARIDADLRLLARRALQRRALECFTARVAAYAPRIIGRPLPPVALSNAQTRWGSCSLQSGIRLNWRLIHFRLELIDYVAVHELAHLVHMNHSPRFWSVVEGVFPAYRQAREELKQLAATCPQL